jgi:hypothetical protein
VTARRVRAAVHWAAVTLLALCAVEAAPFDGPYATASSTVIALGVGLIGYATAPRLGART